MSNLLSDWSPSGSTMDLLRYNGLKDEDIEKALSYLKTQSGLEYIERVNGYDSWDAFFIMFCIKAAGSPHKDLMSEQDRPDAVK